MDVPVRKLTGIVLFLQCNLIVTPALPGLFVSLDVTPYSVAAGFRGAELM